MMNLQTFVISLQRSLQRREKAQSELSRTKLSWAFLDAVDGSKLQYPIPEYKSKKVNRLLGFDMTPNEIGCYLSHRLGWQACVDRNIPTLIFEDDFILLPDFETCLEILLLEFTDWQLVRLQALTECEHDTVKKLGKATIVKNHGDPLGATAYIVKPQAARMLLEHSKNIFEPLDHFLEHERKHGVEMLAIKPYPVTISRAQSTIADRPSDRQSVRGLKKMSRSFYRFMDRLFASDPWFPK